MKILGFILVALGIGWCLLAGFVTWVYVGAQMNADNPPILYHLAGGLTVAALGYFLVKREKQ